MNIGIANASLTLEMGCKEPIMKNAKAYNIFVQSLEKNASGGLFFHRIEEKIYITDHTHRLLGIWDLATGNQAQPV